MMRFILLFLFSISSYILYAQSWNTVRENQIERSGQRDFYPNEYILAEVDDTELRSILWSASDEAVYAMKDSPTRLTVMLSDGSVDHFGIVSYQMMAPGLAAKYPDIKTFKGRSLSDPYRTIRIDYTVHGFRAKIRDLSGVSFIDYFQRQEKNYRVIYRREDYPNDSDFHCAVTDQKIEEFTSDVVSDSRVGTCDLLEYRLAVATTGEYSNYHGADEEGESALVQSAVTTVINRVNEVYEIDFGVTLELIDNNDDIYYYNGATDPYTNGSGGAMLSENQTNIDNVIGNANYDIGHVFSTGGGGVASLFSVCSNNSKARGVTGQGAPIGDPFSIDYVAHEMGHQFGATHTFNNSCGGNRTNSTAFEPGSGSTIMAYAGICSPNVQSNSDDHMHTISITNALLGNGGSSLGCAVDVSGYNNNSPAVTVDAASYNIPRSTYFVLEADGSDVDGDSLTYCWEQMDNEIVTMPPASTNTGGPAFRSNSAIPSGKRFFPNMNAIKTNTMPTWEVIPSVARNMDFRVTVRDIHDVDGEPFGGCTAEADVDIDVDGSSGPFEVTSHATSATWVEGENITITWDVANTDNATVNCTDVEIYFSLDGSFENPILVTTTPNDGSQVITVPDGVTTTGRYMVRGAGNIFFDINDADFTVEESDPTFTIDVSPESGSVCNTGSLVTTVIVGSLESYTVPVNLSATGMPAGVIATFGTNPVTPGNSTTLTLSNLGSTQGEYDITIQGANPDFTKQVNYLADIHDTPVAPTLISPVDDATNVATLPTLVWQDQTSILNHTYEVSTSPGGVGVIESGLVAENMVTLTTELQSATEYYWRVSTKNLCGASEFSADYKFTTNDVRCTLYESDDLPVAIDPVVVGTVTSDLLIQDRGDIIDVNVIDLEGTHTYVDDLIFTLSSPDMTDVVIWDQPCGFQDDFDINLDDEADNSDWPCPPTDGQTYLPDNELSAFGLEEMQGTWTLSVQDVFPQDGGDLEKWGIEVCAQSFCDLTVSSPASSGAATLLEAYGCSIDNETIILTDAIAGETITLPGGLIIDKDLTIIADPTDNITVLFTGPQALTISSGKTVTLNGFTISSTGSAPSITNNGTLTLQSLDVIHPTQNQIENNSGSALTIEGTCNIQE